MKKALLIIDVQNDYFDGGANPLFEADKAAANAQLLLDDFRKNHYPVIHIRHISTSSAATFFLPDTQGAEIYPPLIPVNGETIFIKHFANSFRETGLHDYLLQQEITDLVILGMMTQHCVDTTTRAAKDLGFNCTLIGDACATKDLEIFGNLVKAKEVQTAFLAALNFFFSNVVDTETYLSSSK